MPPQQQEPSQPIPRIYRLTFTYIEPALAFLGALQLLTNPTSYLAIATPTLASSQLTVPLLAAPQTTALMRTLYAQIVAGWLIIVFNDVVTLRVFARDARVWRCVLGAHLMSDVVYSWALWLDRGTRKTLDFPGYDVLEWFTVVTTIVPMGLKLAFILGCGVEFGGGGKGKRA